MLTKRELEVLKLRHEGKTQADVAETLNISQPAVSNFERNGKKKVAAAQDLLKHLKDIGLLALILLFFPLLAANANAANPGHSASRVSAGTFESGNYVFPAQLDITGNLIVNTSKFFVNASSGSVSINSVNPQFTLDVNGTANISTALYTPQICLSGSCITSWAANGNVTGSGSMNYTARWLNGTHVTTGILYDNGSRVGIGTTNPGYTLDITGTLRTTGAVTAATLNTGLGDYELYAMDQNLQIADAPTFAGLITSGSIRTSGGSSRGTSAIDLQLTRASDDQVASGNYAAALAGGNNIVNGTYAAAIGGLNLISGTYGGLVIGWNNSLYDGNATAAIYGDKVFVIGNGTANTSRNNAFYVTNSGTVFIGTRLGIGKHSPTTALDVNGSIRIENITGERVFSIDVATGIARFGDYNNNVSVFINGTLNATGHVEANSGFDFSETFSAESAMGPGDLVAIGSSPSHVKLATQADSDLVIGAVSTQPGFILAKQGLANPVLIGFSGRIPVKVTGIVLAGDFITISAIPGVGERATRAGYVIGRALEKANNGVVTIIIQPTYFNPAVQADGSLVGGREEKKVFVDESEAGKAAKGQIDPAAIEAAVDQAVGAAIEGAVQEEVQQQLSEADISQNATNLTITGALSSESLQTDTITPQSGKDVIIVLG